MAQYAVYECSDCGIKLAKNELKSHSEDIVVERSTGQFASGRSNNKVRYQTRQLLLCSGCVDERIRLEAARRAARRRAILRNFFILVILAVGLVVAVAMNLPSSSTTAATGSDTKADSSALAASSNAQPAKTAATSNGESIDPKDEASSAEDGVSVDAKPVVAELQLQDITPATDAHLKIALANALNSGQTTSWRSLDGSAQGEVLVGAPVERQGQTCRSFGYIVGRGSDRWKAPVAVACKAQAGDWAPQRSAGTPAADDLPPF
jgi:surface antigen